MSYFSTLRRGLDRCGACQRRVDHAHRWAAIDPFSERAVQLARTPAERRIYVDPILSIFEKQANGKEPENAMFVQATRKMIAYTGVLHTHGLPIVVGSHTSVLYAEAVTAATRTGARFLGPGHELGTIEPGKLADLVVLDADPLADITRRASLVMVDGKILDRRPPDIRPARSAGREAR